MFKKNITNPFGDDSSDEDEVTNPFARKRPTRKIPSSNDSSSSDDGSNKKQQT